MASCTSLQTKLFLKIASVQPFFLKQCPRCDFQTTNELMRIRAPLCFEITVRLSARKFYTYFRYLFIAIENVFEK